MRRARRTGRGPSWRPARPDAGKVSVIFCDRRSVDLEPIYGCWHARREARAPNGRLVTEQKCIMSLNEGQIGRCAKSLNLGPAM